MILGNHPEFGNLYVFNGLEQEEFSMEIISPLTLPSFRKRRRNSSRSRFKRFQKKIRNSLRIFAERKGFEPSIQLPVYYLSRVAPSTTRTPFFLSQMAKVKFILQFRNFSTQIFLKIFSKIT